MAIDDPDVVQGGWARVIPGGPNQLGAVIRSAQPLDEVVEDWPRPKRHAGPLTWIYPLISAAAETWSITAREVIAVPAELATELVRKKHARLARPDEIPEA